MHKILKPLQKAYPKKFVKEARVFRNIRRGDKIFVSTGCGQPQYLIKALINYIQSHPGAFYDTEVFHVWSLGVAPYADEKFRDYFRHNSFFVSDSTRESVNKGTADYTPIFLSRVAELFKFNLVPLDVALIQVSLPDEHGYVSLGISVDMTKAAVENSKLIIAQVNVNMPRVHGDGFIHLEDIDYLIPYDEPILEFTKYLNDDVADQIGKYVSRLIQNGDTLQVGYGSTTNTILSNLADKKHLGIHTELFTDGIANLMQKGVIDNSRKTLDRGRSVASFCMGSKETYNYLHNNPMIEFRNIDYTNNPLVIAQQKNMVAINGALQIDLSGQASVESISGMLYSGIGGQADFMRGSALAPYGKNILTLPSTSEDGESSRIVPFLDRGTGVTLNRSDIYYVVTEYGIAFLPGKNVRERAMSLIAIAHPKFKPWLIEKAKKQNIIYQDQAFIPGKAGEYPEHLETYRTTRQGMELLLRPVKISDESLIKDFYYSLSDESLHRRFLSMLKSMPHKRLQKFVVIDYTKDTVILAVKKYVEDIEEVVGIGQYSIDPVNHTADVAFAIRDDYQGHGIGTQLLLYLTYLAKRQGLLGFTADVLADNWRMLHLFGKMGFDIKKRLDAGAYTLTMTFKTEGKDK